MRPWAEHAYGVPPDQVVGTTFKLHLAGWPYLVPGALTWHVGYHAPVEVQ